VTGDDQLFPSNSQIMKIIPEGCVDELMAHHQNLSLLT
jgi:hypothetical protein